METLVRLRGVAKDYKRGAETVHVLHQLDLDIPKGDFLALMGPSGSGKSTLLNLIGGLDRPSAGTIEIAGQRTDSLSDGQLGKLARESRRLRVPDVQPAAGADGGTQRRVAAAAHFAVRRGPTQARRRRARASSA